MYVSATADTLFGATYKVKRPGNYGWTVREGSHCIVRGSAFVPPETIACSVDADCSVRPQVSTCGQRRVCSCPKRAAMGERIRNPVIEYLNFSVEDPRSQFVSDGASPGGHIYRGRAIRSLRGQFGQGDFALNLLDRQILVAKPKRGRRSWKLRRAFVFDPADPIRSGFMKSIGQDADGELYAIRGNFTPTGLEGRIWRIASEPRKPRRARNRFKRRHLTHRYH